MPTVDVRYDEIAASFAAHYYRLLVESASSLPQLYSPSAAINHCNKRCSGPAELSSVLGAHLLAAPLTHVKVETLTVSRKPTGNFGVEVQGELQYSSAPANRPAQQRFTQDVELKELSEADTFAIMRDTVRFVTAAIPRWGATSPELAAAQPAAAVPPLAEPLPAAPAPEAPAAAKPEEQQAAPAAAAPAAAKAEKESEPKPEEPRRVDGKPVGSDGKPLTFAQVARLNAGKQPAAAHQPQRVVAAPAAAPAAKKDAAADGAAKPKREAKDKKPAAEPKEGEHKEGGEGRKGGAAPGERRPRAAKTVVYYDVIVKGLDKSVTEAEVRATVNEELCPIRLVKIDSQPSKRNPDEIRTCAFVQFDHDALKTAGTDLAAAIAKVLGADRGKTGKITIEAVKETKYANRGEGRRERPKAAAAAAATESA